MKCVVLVTLYSVISTLICETVSCTFLQQLVVLNFGSFTLFYAFVH